MVLWKFALIWQQIWKIQQGPQDWKTQFSFQSPRKAKNVKECWRTLKLPHDCIHLKCWQSNAQNSPSRLEQYVNRDFPDLQVGFRKGRGPEIKLPTSAGSSKKQESSRKKIYFCFIDYAKAFNCVGHNKLENSERDGNTRPPVLSHEKSVWRSESNT